MKTKITIAISFLLCLIGTDFCVAQTHQLLKNFNLGKASCQLFSVQQPGSDTTFYYIYKRGYKTPAAKEIALSINKNNGDTVYYTTYKITRTKIHFTQRAHREFILEKTYSLNKKGKLYLNTSYAVPVPPQVLPSGVNEPTSPVFSGCPMPFDNEATFPGGMVELRKFTSLHLTYPEAALKNDISGRVSVKFSVAKDGTINNIEIKRGLGYGCDEEAIRLIKKMPKWQPARLNGKAVVSTYYLPILFYLQD